MDIAGRLVVFSAPSPVRRLLSKAAASLLLLALVATGCATGQRPGFPRQSYDEAKTIKRLEASFQEDVIIDGYYRSGTTAEQRQALRDKLIDGRVALMDLNYQQFVASMSFHRQSIDTAGEFAELGANLATTIVGGAAAKTALGAVSAGISGAKLSVDKNFFYEKTIPVLVSAMEAQRKTVLVDLLTGRAKDDHEYSLAQAISDLNRYYFAGTFLGGLQSIQADAGAKQKDAEQWVVAYAYNEDPAAKSIKAFLFPKGPKDPKSENVALLKKWFQTGGVPSGTTVSEFLRQDRFKEQRMKALHEVQWLR